MEMAFGVRRGEKWLLVIIWCDTAELKATLRKRPVVPNEAPVG